MIILSFAGRQKNGKTASKNLCKRIMLESLIEKDKIGIIHLPQLSDAINGVNMYSSILRVRECSFAAPLRKMIYAGFDLKNGTLEEDKDRLISGYNFSSKGVITNRDLMVAVAESLRERLGYGLFVQMMERKINEEISHGQTELFIIDDLRKDVEFDLLCGYENSYTVWVENTKIDNDYDGEIDREECDYEIDWETPEELDSALRGILKDLEVI